MPEQTAYSKGNIAGAEGQLKKNVLLGSSLASATDPLHSRQRRMFLELYAEARGQGNRAGPEFKKKVAARFQSSPRMMALARVRGTLGNIEKKLNSWRGAIAENTAKYDELEDRLAAWDSPEGSGETLLSEREKFDEFVGTLSGELSKELIAKYGKGQKKKPIGAPGFKYVGGAQRSWDERALLKAYKDIELKKQLSTVKSGLAQAQQADIRLTREQLGTGMSSNLLFAPPGLARGGRTVSDMAYVRRPAPRRGRTGQGVAAYSDIYSKFFGGL